MPRLAISVSKLEGWASARPGSGGVVTFEFSGGEAVRWNDLLGI